MMMINAIILTVVALAAPQTPVSESRAIVSGPYEASGLAAVPGAGGVLFVDDGTTDAVMWMALDRAGAQQGNAVRVPLGVTVVDPEGMTFDGTYFYVVGSQSKAKKATGDAGVGLVRFTFDPETRAVGSVEHIDGLGRLLTEKLPELARLTRNGGLNIEGLAWDPRNARLLVGLRGPMSGEDALVVPLTFAGGQFSASGLTVASPGLVRLSLGGHAIRSIEYDPEAKAFLVVAGAPESKARTDFVLWEWDGGDGLRERQRLHRDLKPEGVARFGEHTLVVCDSSRYLLVD